MNKNNYRWIKIGGMALFVPIVLVSGPLMGYYVGEFFIVKYNWSYDVQIFLVLAGVIFGINETISIIRKMIKAGKCE